MADSQPCPRPRSGGVWQPWWVASLLPPLVGPDQRVSRDHGDQQPVTCVMPVDAAKLPATAWSPHSDVRMERLGCSLLLGRHGPRSSLQREKGGTSLVIAGVRRASSSSRWRAFSSAKAKTRLVLASRACRPAASFGTLHDLVVTIAVPGGGGAPPCFQNLGVVSSPTTINILILASRAGRPTALLGTWHMTWCLPFQSPATVMRRLVSGTLASSPWLPLSHSTCGCGV